MDAIDLLFAAKPNSERLHQAALKVLLETTPLLASLTGRDLQTMEVYWEPDGGAADLVAITTTGEQVYIELKIDSKLSRGQIHQQLKYSAAPHTLLYVLLGTSEIAHGERWGQWSTILAGRPRPPIVDGTALKRHIHDALTPDTTPAVRDLAAAYIRLLDDLAQRTRAFADKPVDQFAPRDYLGFFDQLRTHEPLGTTSTVAHVRAKGRHFVCCAWQGVPALGLYMQFEDQHLRLKLHAAHLDKKDRKAKRKRITDAARAAAKELNLALEPTPGKTGKTMTLAHFPGIKLTSPDDPALHAALRDAQKLVHAAGKRLT